MLSTQCGPEAVLSSLFASTYLILIATPGGRYYNYRSFATRERVFIIPLSFVLNSIMFIFFV